MKDKEIEEGVHFAAAVCSVHYLKKKVGAAV